MFRIRHENQVIVRMLCDTKYHFELPFFQRLYYTLQVVLTFWKGIGHMRTGYEHYLLHF